MRPANHPPKRVPLTVKVEGGYLRWTRWERFQHWVLAAVFIVLAITGFALRYPDAWWMKPFTGNATLFALRGILHRIAAVVFLTLGAVHFVWLVGVRRGRAQLSAMAPRLRDIGDAARSVGANLGLVRRAPRFGHYTYAEKAEYWALIWGALVMGVSGVGLWAKGTTMSLAPRWVIDLLTVIHLYEAWLATLAILVWHFYFVIFNPDVYPVQASMLHGRLSEEELQEEHGAEWDEIQALEEAEKVAGEAAEVGS